MKAKILSTLSMIFGVFGFSQTTEIYFKYDEAGNQKYRGTSATSNRMAQTNAIIQPSEKSEEDRFWGELNIYPVPVKDILTIQWTNAANDLIDTVSLYQHSTTSWNFQQKNVLSLNRQVQINMSGYYLGVYVLSFTLKDGRVYTKNIIKE